MIILVYLFIITYICSASKIKSKPMDLLQPYIYNIIRDECSKAESSQKSPKIASENAIWARLSSDVRTALSELEADGLVVSYENVNKIKMYSLRADKERRK